LEKAELRRVRFHDLRHTFASLLIQNGESLAYVRDQLGHSSIQITVDTYGHLVPGANRQAVDRLDDTQDRKQSQDADLADDERAVGAVGPSLASDRYRFLPAFFVAFFALFFLATRTNFGGVGRVCVVRAVCGIPAGGSVCSGRS
jgi:hypothetical protein